MAGTNVKLGVEYSQFKQGMKESSAAVKTLEQALKLNEAQLKQNGNEELVLQNRTKILTDQIEAQKNVVTQAENALRLMNEKGVEKTSVEFQKMQQEEFNSVMFEEYDEQFMYFLGVALALLVLEMLIGERRSRRHLFER